ncbi:hypothetical protein Tco_0852875 [Tanacetum coccineum]
MYYPRFTKVIIYYFLTQDKTLSWRNNIRMHTSRDDYLINTLRFVSAKEETQIYGAILHDSLTSPEMKETKAYKTYLGFATGATPPKKVRKFKKPASPKLTTVPVSTKEPTRKSKRVNRPTKKSTKVPVRGVVIRETPEIQLSKKREKVDVTRGKGIELLSQVALNEDAQFEEIIPSVTSEGTDDSNIKQDSSGEDSDKENDNNNDKTQSDNDDESNSEHETNENESGSESDQEENEENEDDKEEVKDEFVKTPSDDYDDKDETKITDKAKGDEDEEMDYTTSQLYDDVDIRVNELVDSDKVVTALEKEVTELKKDPLQTQVIAFVDDHLDARLGATRDEFMNCLSSFITARVTDQVKIHLPQILPKEESSQPQSSYEAAATLIEFELKKIMINKMDKSESYLAAPEHRECYKGLNKFYDLDKTIFSNYSKVKSVQSKEPELEVRDSNMPQDQEENPGNDDEEPKEKVASKCDWFTKPAQPQEPTDPDWNVSKTPQQGQHQSWLITLASSAKKPSKTFDEQMSTPNRTVSDSS